MFTALINVSGDIPMNDDPPEFETAREAWEYLADERERHEKDGNPTGSDGGIPGRFTTPLDKMRRIALAAQWNDDMIIRPGGVSEWPVNVWGVGYVWGDTPGCDGDNDPGLIYSVVVVR